MSHVVAVCRVASLHLDTGLVGVTAIDKRPVDGPVAQYGPYTTNRGRILLFRP